MTVGHQKGRGAVSNTRSARFDELSTLVDGEWLDHCIRADEQLSALKSEVTIETPRTIVTRNNSPDIPFDRSINAYRGCEHGCVYCFARPTHAYLNLSPGLDFERRLFAKPNAAALLVKELRSPRYECQPIALGTNTDPYQPIEARFRITREILSVLDDHNHPVTITTKSARVLDDLPILARMASRGLATVIVSVTSLDPRLARTLEPRASAPRLRLYAIRELAASGVPTSVAVSPCIPGLTDHEIEAILARAAEAGAHRAHSIILRLPYEVAPLFKEWLALHHPLKLDRVMKLVREARGGKDNEGRFYERFRPVGPYAATLRARFEKAVKRSALDRAMPELRTDLFRKPAAQLQLF